MPYYGPRTRVVSNFLNDGRSPYIVKTGYVQKSPYTSPLPYTFVKGWDKTLAQPASWGFKANTPGTGSVSVASFSSAYSKAYGKFIEKMRETVNLAVDIAERKQAVDMIASRGMQILRFANHLKSLRFSEAARDLNLVVLQKKNSRRYVKLKLPDREVKLKKRLKSFGDNFLEFHFGWEPLIGDIGGAVEILHDTPFAGLTRRVVASATERYSALSIPTVPLWYDVAVTHWPHATVRIAADVKITDPNIARLNQMGFVNPAVIAWELVPFSFVVDWFANVGQVLSAYTDQAGFAYENAYSTVFAQSQTTTYRTGGVPTYGNRYGQIATLPVYQQFGTYVTRAMGVSTPKFAFKPVKWPSVTRGLTAVSLLTQFLRA